MARGSKNYEEHSFWCINCGQPTIPLTRKQGFQHGRFHRKKLWCYHCKTEINCVECKTPEDVEIFKEDFMKGLFIDEAQESMAACGSAGLG